jgi:hypothetical protein
LFIGAPSTYTEKDATQVSSDHRPNFGLRPLWAAGWGAPTLFAVRIGRLQAPAGLLPVRFLIRGPRVANNNKHDQ